LIAYRKAGAEKESISVATLRGILEELREELGRKTQENERLWTRLGGLESRLEHVSRLEGENAVLRRDTEALSERVDQLEAALDQASIPIPPWSKPQRANRADRIDHRADVDRP
jgi:predicted nuclease with TOPRIM domain